jgi:hypothetical protein
VNGEQAYRFALANAPRNPDGGVSEEYLVETVAHVIDFDPEKERRGLAQRIVSRRKRPGQTDPAGKVCIPGLEAYEFEPDRLIADEDGNVVENSRALIAHKRAEARRAGLAADRAAERLLREQGEADAFGEWTAAEVAKGRDQRTLTFGEYLREGGFLEDGLPA